MLIAPTEPPKLRAQGAVAVTPERYGVDVLWAARHTGLVGVQRKEFPGDFLSSKDDGRLTKEIAQMQALDVAVLSLEGRGAWTTDGVLVHQWGPRWSRSSHRRYLFSVQARGIWVAQTDNLDDTIALIGDLHEWSGKAKHHSTEGRPAPKRDSWGRVTDRSYQLHVTQDLPDVGPELAARILDTVGFPFALTVTEADLMRVHGIGKAKAHKIVRAFTNGDDQ